MPEEVKHLKTAHRIERDRRRADRIKAILLLNDGLSYPDIAKILLLDDTTISVCPEHTNSDGGVELCER